MIGQMHKKGVTDWYNLSIDGMVLEGYTIP